MGRDTKGVFGLCQVFFKKNKISQSIAAKRQHALNWRRRHKGTVTVPLLLSVLEIFRAERGRRNISDGKNAG